MNTTRHPTTTPEQLTTRAHERALIALTSYGNDVGSTQFLAIHELMDGLTKQALGIEPGRFAYGLPPGTGKTQSLIAWVAAAWELRLGLSVAISASQIEALCGINQQLIAAGVPANAIGLRHSHGKDAPLADTGESDRPIMLVSHSRIHGGKNAALFSQHRERPRDLLIWDETLMTASAKSLSWRDINFAAKHLEGELASTSALAMTLRAVCATVQAELEAQKSQPPRSEISFGSIDLSAAQAEADALVDWGGPMRSAAIKTVRALVRMIDFPLAVARTGSGATGDGVISYAITVDSVWSNIAVLDASHAVRGLARNGGIVDRTTTAMRECKSYENVTVSEIRMSAGKASLQGSGSLEEAASRIADLIRKTDSMEPVLVVTFKSEAKRLERLLENLEGIDMTESINGKPRISILTWGRETSLNTFGHCKHVILLGVLRRNLLDLTASAAAAANDLSYRLTSKRRSELERSEAAHLVLQAMNRGSCRLMAEAGKANRMNLTVIGHVTGLREALAPVLPAVNWTSCIPERKPRTGTETAATANAIAVYLCNLPKEQATLNIKALKAAIKPPLGKV